MLSGLWRLSLGLELLGFVGTVLNLWGTGTVTSTVAAP